MISIGVFRFRMQKMKKRQLSRNTYRLIQKLVEKDLQKCIGANDKVRGGEGATVPSPTFSEMPSCSFSDDTDMLSLSSSDSMENMSQTHLSDVSSSSCSDIGSDVDSDTSFDKQSLESDAWSGGSENSFGHTSATFDTAKIQEGASYHSWEEKIRTWAVRHQITLAGLGDLLKMLKPQFPELHVDPKTVLRTGKKVEVECMGEGLYYNFGLKSRLSRWLQASKLTGDTAYLNFNIDGIPIYKSSRRGLLPILCFIVNSSLPPFVCAAYFGPGKPSLPIFLKDFCPDLDDLLDNGIHVDGKLYNVEVKAFVCDAPGRAYVKGVKGHGAFAGCERCTVVGKKYRDRTVFLNSDADLRTDESFYTLDHAEHHKEVSPLSEIGIPMVSGFPLDYMHLVCLGVMRTLLFKWRKRKKKFRLSKALFKLIERLMLNAASTWPSDFSRKPRSFEELKMWKATELRQFLLYLGAVVLKKHFPAHVYSHFLLLHAAITIFTRTDLVEDFHEEAVTMLRDFVLKGKSSLLYGSEFLVYNVHNLLHIGDDVTKYGVLDNVSAFPFENHLQQIKRSIKGKAKPLHELVNRLRTREMSLEHDRPDKQVDGVVPWRHKAKRRPTAGLSDGCHYSKFMINKRTVSLREGDNFVMLQNSSVIRVLNVYGNKDGLHVIGERFTQYRSLYTEPIDSALLGIFMVDALSTFPRSYLVQKIKCKCVAIPHERRGSYAIFPLMGAA